MKLANATKNVSKESVNELVDLLRTTQEGDQK